MSPIMEQKQMNGNVATDDVRWNPYSKKYVKKLKLQTQQSKLTQTTFKLNEMHTNWIVGIRQDTARTPQTSVTREGDVLTTSTNMSNTVNNDTGDTRDIQENDVLLELEEEFVEHIAESRMENAREDFEEECSYLYGNIEDDDFFSLSHQPWS